MTEPRSCPTVAANQECIFPYFYFGVSYSGCVALSDGRSWCPTQVDENMQYTGVWAYCAEGCPVREYEGYVPRYDARTRSVNWCHKQRPADCLQTNGLEGVDPHNFTALLQASKKPDLSDLKEAFTPSAEEIQDLGSKPQEFITSCTFDQTTCTFKDFYVWQSDTYGNCFTFNSPNLYLKSDDGGFVKDNFMRKTRKAGYQNGLRLTLNLDVSNYVSLLSSDLGVRAVVHHPRVTPIPEEEGFSVSPAFLTSIGIRR
ncbi:Fibronectin type II collagen-binding, partial [Trinorchestia longiramus]